MSIEDEILRKSQSILDYFSETERNLRAQLAAVTAERDKEAATGEDWFRRYNACSDECDAHQGEAVDARNERDAALTQVAMLREALATAAIPLEVLLATEMDSAWLSPVVKLAIRDGVNAARTALRESEQTKEPISIIVNGKDHIVSTPTMTYEQIVELAATGRNSIHSVTYHTAGLVGSLIPGRTIKVEPGMIFNAYVTDNA